MNPKPEPAPVYHLPRQPSESQLGHCMVCGASFREYIACESGNCHWVRDQTEDAA